MRAEINKIEDRKLTKKNQGNQKVGSLKTSIKLITSS